MMPKPESPRWVLIPAVLSVVLAAGAFALAIAVPVEQVAGKTKCVGMMAVGALGFILGILGLVGAIRSRHTAGIVAAALGVFLSLGVGSLGLIGFAWIWIDLKD